MNTTIPELARKESAWQEFLTHKTTHQQLTRKEETLIRDFITRQAYLPLCDAWEKGVFPSSLPVRHILNKTGSDKKRTVYSFPGDEGIFLKFVAFHLYQYDNLFCGNCYAFRRNYGVRDALRRMRKTPSLSQKYCLKVDISNYFNSIDVDILLDKLAFLKEKDGLTYELLCRILREPRVFDEHAGADILTESHGAMAGTPISSFLANLYLSDMDWFFARQGVLYFRYSDDILLFADSIETLAALQKILYDKISDLKLCLNPDKVRVSKPGQVIEFLGFSYQDGKIDLSDYTIRKTKAKIKRKAEALRRWQRKKGLSGEKAAVGFICAMNHKFYGAPQPETPFRLDESEDFTWAKWFFPNLTCDAGLKEIDAYFQNYIRYTVTGRHYKGNYRIRYEDLKRWGYRSLVHEYYNWQKGGAYVPHFYR